jgi:hypothetical protein
MLQNVGGSGVRRRRKLAALSGSLVLGDNII